MQNREGIVNYFMGLLIYRTIDQAGHLLSDGEKGEVDAVVSGWPLGQKVRFLKVIVQTAVGSSLIREN